MKRLVSEGLIGDYYEFGLYRGYTFWYAQQAADQAAISAMRFFGFDSFQGLPDVEGEDKKAGIFISGDYAWTRSAVERDLASHGFDWTRGTFDRGLLRPIADTVREARSADGPRRGGDGRLRPLPIDCTGSRLRRGPSPGRDNHAVRRLELLRRRRRSRANRGLRRVPPRPPTVAARVVVDFGTYGKAFIIRDATVSSVGA